MREPFFAEDRELASRSKPLSITSLTQRVKHTLEASFPYIWVVGEITNFKRAASGHWYFNLRDANSQVRCNMWRTATGNVRFRPTDGKEVLVSGSLNVYPPRGEYSLIVESMEEVGLGRLRQAFEQLKQKLQAEGLFDPAHKRPLPLLPRKIGVVTSSTGAAIRDILRVLSKRFAGMQVLLYPARVQGEGAGAEIAEGIGWLDRHGGCDLLIVGRGGGSEEDLWCFNEEIVARAIFAARTPLISAVGHQTDITIADFVADVSAATPSHAAEIAVKSREEYGKTIDLLVHTLDRAMQRKLLLLKNRINISESHPIFISVRSRVNDYQRRLSDLEYRLQKRLFELVADRRLRLMRGGERLNPDKLRGRARLAAGRLAEADRELYRKIDRQLDSASQKLVVLVRRLQDLSPLKTLARGYAAVFTRENKVVKHPADVSLGELVRIRLAEGELSARIVDQERRAVQQDLF